MDSVKWNTLKDVKLQAKTIWLFVLGEASKKLKLWSPVADPGFPVGGGVDLVGGAVDPRGGYVSKILHVKTKESGP